jgi:hypothetical protein
MLISFSDWKGIMLVEFVLPGQTVSQKSQISSVWTSEVAGSSCKARIVLRQVDAVPWQRALTYSAFCQGVFGGSRSWSWSTPLTRQISLHVTSSSSSLGSVTYPRGEVQWTVNVWDTESMYVIHQLTLIHLKRRINAMGSFYIADSFSFTKFPVPFVFQASFKKHSVIKNLWGYKNDKVEFVIVISLWRHHNWTEKVISERRDVVVYLPFVVFGRWQQETGHDFTTCSKYSIYKFRLTYLMQMSQNVYFCFLLRDLPSVSSLHGPQLT